MDRQYLVHLYGDRFTREWFHTYNNQLTVPLLVHLIEQTYAVPNHGRPPQLGFIQDVLTYVRHRPDVSISSYRGTEVLIRSEYYHYL